MKTIQSHTECCVRIVFAFSSYCDQLKLSESTHVLQPFLPSILEGLVQLAAQFSSEVLTLVMETLCIVCTVNPAFTTSAENKICPLTIAIFLKYNNGTAAASSSSLPSPVLLRSTQTFISCLRACLQTQWWRLWPRTSSRNWPRSRAARDPCRCVSSRRWSASCRLRPTRFPLDSVL